MPNDTLGACTKSHANPNLLRALSHRKSNGPINSDECERERDGRKSTEQHRIKALGDNPSVLVQSLPHRRGIINKLISIDGPYFFAYGIKNTG